MSDMTELENLSSTGLAFECVPLICSHCGNTGEARRKPGDKYVFCTTDDFYLRCASIQSSSIQVVCDKCGHVVPVRNNAQPSNGARR
jgi:hypothetical protein